jgi:hypothetical protein
MNIENLSYLHDKLKYLGFGENTLLNQQLEQEIAKDAREFTLYTEAFFDDFTKLEATLYFQKSDAKERYNFIKYDALLRYSEDPAMNRTQSFYIYKGKGVTFKEAFNLLEGRAVNKDLTNLEGEKYNAWLQLNFEEKDMHDNFRVRQFSSKYRYELEKVLERYPIRELQLKETKEILLKSLQRGNLQLVTFEKASKTEKMFIEANPMFKTINIYSLASRAAKTNGNKVSQASAETAGQTLFDQSLPGPVNEEAPEDEQDDPISAHPAVIAPTSRKRMRK